MHVFWTCSLLIEGTRDKTLSLVELLGSSRLQEAPVNLFVAPKS
jgi:hypothetical protein